MPVIGNPKNLDTGTLDSGILDLGSGGRVIKLISSTETFLKLIPSSRNLLVLISRTQSHG